jgi:hypothetical protein
MRNQGGAVVSNLSNSYHNARTYSKIYIQRPAFIKKETKSDRVIHKLKGSLFAFFTKSIDRPLHIHRRALVLINLYYRV